jgi:hypothetical protein
MAEDDELDSMQQIKAALTPLDEPTRNRVLQWAVSRFIGSTGISLSPSLDQPAVGPVATSASNGQTFETFAELFEAARPSTEKEKGLVAGYWVQICQGEPSFGSQVLNDALKDLGHGVGNITDALSGLKDERPALLLQLKKSGTSKQARKTYKLTVQGIRRVQGMLSGDASAAAE